GAAAGAVPDEQSVRDGAGPPPGRPAGGRRPGRRRGAHRGAVPPRLRPGARARRGGAGAAVRGRRRGGGGRRLGALRPGAAAGQRVLLRGLIDSGDPASREHERPEGTPVAHAPGSPGGALAPGVVRPAAGGVYSFQGAGPADARPLSLVYRREVPCPSSCSAPAARGARRGPTTRSAKRSSAPPATASSWPPPRPPRPPGPTPPSRCRP